MRVQILGPSSANCLKLEIIVRASLAELGMRDARVERVTQPQETRHLLWGEPPGLAIDGQLVWSGGNPLPTKDWIRQVLRETILMPA